MASITYQQGNPWQMAIAVDLRDRRFSTGTRFVSTIAAVITGDNVDKAILNTENNFWLDDIVQFGDKVRLGPNTDNNDTEELEILASHTNKEGAATTGIVYLKYSDTTLDYEVSDPYTLFGQGKAEAWFPYGVVLKCEGIKSGIIQLGYRGRKTITNNTVSSVETIGSSYFAIVNVTLGSGEYLLGSWKDGSYYARNITLSENAIEPFNIIDMSTSGIGKIRFKTTSLWSVGNNVTVNALIGTTHLGGYRKSYAQRLSMQYGPYGSPNQGQFIQFLLEAGQDAAAKATLVSPWKYSTLVTNAYYRVGIIYRAIFTSNKVDPATTYIFPYIDPGAYSWSEVITFSALTLVTTGTRDTGWVKYLSSPVNLRTSGIKHLPPSIKITTNVGTLSGQTPTVDDRLILYLDDIILEHSAGLSYPSDGCVDFGRYNVWPDMGSVSWSVVEETSSKEVISSLSDSKADYRYVIKASFSYVSQEFWNDMLKLLTWQSKGFLLTLHPYIDDVPPILVGKLSIVNIKKNFWDLTKRSFELTFTEDKDV